MWLYIATGALEHCEGYWGSLKGLGDMLRGLSYLANLAAEVSFHYAWTKVRSSLVSACEQYLRSAFGAQQEWYQWPGMVLECWGLALAEQPSNYVTCVRAIERNKRSGDDRCLA